MATRQRTFYTVTCDGGHSEPRVFGTVTHASAIEARSAAYAEGWRFPAKLLANGDQSPVQVSDVCPDCVPGFTPQWVINPHDSRQGRR